MSLTSIWIKPYVVCGLKNETTKRKLLTVKDLIVAKVYKITKGMEVVCVSCRQLTKSTKLIRLPMRVLEACTAGSVVELTIH